MIKSSVAVAAVLAVMTPVWMANAQNTDSDTMNTTAPQAQADATAGAPEVNVETKAPEVTVEVPEPKVTVEVPDPKVSVEQAEPKVTVKQAEPEVTVKQGEPNVEVKQGEPKVTVEQVKSDETGATMEATDAEMTAAGTDTTVKQDMERRSARDLQSAIMDAKDAVADENQDEALDAVNQALSQIDTGASVADDQAKADWQDVEDSLSDAKSAIQDSDWQQAGKSLQEALTPVRQQLAMTGDTTDDMAATDIAANSDIENDSALDLNLSEDETADAAVGSDIDTSVDEDMDVAAGTATDPEMDTAAGTDIDTDMNADVTADSNAVAPADTAAVDETMDETAPATNGKQSAMASKPLDDNPIYGLRADELTDRDVVDANGEDIGDVEDVVIGRGDNTAYAIIEFGGILGIGDKEVAIPLDQLTLISEDQVLLKGGITEEQLEQFPDYNEDDYLEVTEDQRVRDVMLQ